MNFTDQQFIRLFFFSIGEADIWDLVLKFGGFVSLLSVLVTVPIVEVETTTMGTSSGGEESEISETISHR